MEIADPQRIELRIDLPVSDALLLKEGAEVVAFFDALSLESFAASVEPSQLPCRGAARRRVGLSGDGGTGRDRSAYPYRLARFC